MDNNESKKIWEKQEWESDISFGYFQKYFLLQPIPRSLTRGYRRYLIEVRGWDEDKANKRNAPGGWQKWSQGKNHDGSPLSPDAVSWQERAKSYDGYFAMTTEDKILKNRDELLSKERDHAQMQADLWELLFKGLIDLVNYEKKTAEQDDKPFDPIPFITRSKDLWKMREELATFLRRTVLLPDKYRDDQIVDPEEKSAEINWVEAEFDPENIGVGKEEIMELMRGGKRTSQEKEPD